MLVSNCGLEKTGGSPKRVSFVTKSFYELWLNKEIRNKPARSNPLKTVSFLICPYYTAHVCTKINGALGRFLHIAKLSKAEKNILYEHFKDSKSKRFVVFLGDVLCGIFGSARIEKWIYLLLVSEYPTGRLVILEDPSRVIRSEWLLETKMLKFEDMDFPVPSGYEYLLKLWYGNYMEIPEEGKEYLRKEQMEE